MSKRGQQSSASGAAVLVILIATIMVLYILFLPPEDRAELLGEENYSSSTGPETKSGYNKTLLSEQVGRLDYLKFDSRTHELPSFTISSVKEAAIIKSLNSLFVKSTMGDREEFNLTFNIKKRMTTDVNLVFNVKEASGRLEIYLNGHQISNGEYRLGSANPIKISSDLLEDENVLTFRASRVGLAFWKTNRYELENIMISGKILDNSNSVSRQYFYLSNTEKENVESATLRFYPSCRITEVGNLMIYLNGEELFSGVADCRLYNTFDMDLDAMIEGKNELEFIVESGTYNIDRTSIRVNLEESLYPVFYFDLPEELFVDGEKELDEDFNVTLKVRFTNREDKRMEYQINGRKRHIDTDELIFEEEINAYVFAETNSLELIPREVIDIAEVKVLLSEK